jgi:hypothetical protein
MILLSRQLIKRKNLDASKILAASCHPGTVDTDMQKAWTEGYGVPGMFAEFLTRFVGKTAPEGAEASLWLATCTDINAANFAEYQGHYYPDAYGKKETETDQAKDEALGDSFWSFCADRARAILGEDVN